MLAASLATGVAGVESTVGVAVASVAGAISEVVSVGATVSVVASVVAVGSGAVSVCSAFGSDTVEEVSAFVAVGVAGSLVAAG